MTLPRRVISKLETMDDTYTVGDCLVKSIYIKPNYCFPDHQVVIYYENEKTLALRYKDVVKFTYHFEKADSEQDHQLDPQG
jgi:hypothetical protein